MHMTSHERDQLELAVQLLEQPGWVARISSLIGMPIEKGLAMLPERWAVTVHKASHHAIRAALDVAVRSLSPAGPGRHSTRKHQLMAGASGAIGGFFGLAALLVELPLSTTLMLRSIAEIGRSEGEDFRFLESRLSCLEVFALGGGSRSDDAASHGYYAARVALSKMVQEAVEFVAQRGMIAEGAPQLIRLISQVAQRFSVVVSEKVAGQAVPIIGAAGGAAINLAFMQHFQQIAQGHFIVRRLERTVDRDYIRQEYEIIRRKHLAS